MPNSSLLKISDALDRLNRAIGLGVSWLTLVMVVLTFIIVVLRYVFSIGWISVQESVVYMYAVVFMIGAGYTLQVDGHVRVDIFLKKMSDRKQAQVNLWGTVFLLMPTCIFLLWISAPYVYESWRYLEGSVEVGGLNLVYLLKSVIPAMAILLILQGISMIIKSYVQLQSPAENP